MIVAMSYSTKNFINSCRTCLQEKENMQALYSPNIIEMIHSCTTIHVKKDDKLPCKICNECVDNLDKFYTFKNVCAESDKILQSLQYEKTDNNRKNNAKETIFMTVVNVSTCTYLKSDPQIILSNENNAKINEHEPGIKNENLSNETTEIKKCKMKNKDESVSLICSICNKSFARRKQMDRHVLIHSQERKHKCEECGKCFLEKNKLTRHLLVHKPKNKTIPCLLCDKSFSSEFSLRDHQKRCHEGQLKRIVCTICGKDYIDIKCHMKQVHSENSSTKQFKCEQCPKEFKNKIGLVKHIQIKHENNPPPANILCTVCGKRCYSRNELNNHMTKHTNVRSFPCTMCDKSYKLLGALNYHLRSHLNIRPFTCDICSKSFYSSKILKCHLRIHSGEKPYICRLCGKAFTQDGALRNHLKVH